jgi:flagellar biosynthesis/type III secretory pathway protein FliH
MVFVNYVREFHKENGYEDLQDAIERAIDRCIAENILKEFLIEHRSEVVKVMQLDYTFDRQIMLEREDARLEGWTEGNATGREEGWREGNAAGQAAGRAEGRAQEREDSIHTLLKAIQELGHSTETALAQLRNKYQLEGEDAEKYMRLYWNGYKN